MIFGTFDGLHPGHFNLFKQAKALAKNSYLIVSIARDKNVEKIKGRKPDFSEKERLIFVRKSGFPDKVFLAGMNNYLSRIIEERPDIIALGYDQKTFVKNLKKDLKKEGIPATIFRLRPYKKHIYKNSLLKKRGF